MASNSCRIFLLSPTLPGNLLVAEDSCCTKFLLVGNDGKRNVFEQAKRGNYGKHNVFGAARRGSYGKRNVFEPPGAEAMENVMFFSRQPRELWKTY